MVVHEKIVHLYLGTFNSEYFWEDQNFAKLPSVFDPQIETIISAMDEIQVVFCKQSSDVLITKIPLNTAFKNYFINLNFIFLNNEVYIIDNNNASNNSLCNQNICETILKTSQGKDIKELISDTTKFSPYSILPYSHDLCEKYNIDNNMPQIDIVKKINSKIFSHYLSKQIFNNNYGKIVNSAEELNYIARQFLKDSAFLIKELYGVSGKGNIFIDNENMLTIVVRHLKKQEKKGKQTRFLLEHLFDKQHDFSCQFEIMKDGTYRITSIQEMQNNGFAFSGIKSADKDFVDNLEKQGYITQVDLIAKELYQEGYYGPVCLDSMILKDGTIIPIIEINARKSMGLINFYIDEYLEQFSIKGNLIYFSLGMQNEIRFEVLLDKMEQENILFKKENPVGILPLSANTLNVNKKNIYSDKQHEKFSGRFYCSLVANNLEDRTKLISTLKKVFNEMKSTILN